MARVPRVGQMGLLLDHSVMSDTHYIFIGIETMSG